MKYKVGDKVKIKTWNDMEEEFGLNSFDSIDTWPNFNKQMEIEINALNNDRVVTIRDVNGDGHYIMEYKKEWMWVDDMIKGLYVEPVFEPILSRFEILDIKEEK